MKKPLKIIWAVCLMIIVSAGVGLGINGLLTRYLPWIYLSKKHRLEQETLKIENASESSSCLSFSDQIRYQSFQKAVEMHPDVTYSDAVAAWQRSDSPPLLRAVLTKAEGQAPSTEECDSLRLMLKTLEEPVAEWEECERLSRGNSLEKLIAMRRQMLLTRNPWVKEAWDRAAAQRAARERTLAGESTMKASEGVDHDKTHDKATGLQRASLPAAGAPGGGFSMDAVSSGKASEMKTFFPPSDELQAVSWQDFRTLAESGRGLILDARVEKLYRLGHVPRALNLSREEFAQDYERGRSILDASKTRIVAVYCNGLDCEDSKVVAEALLKLGFRRVLIFKGGWQEWTFQHLPRETGDGKRPERGK